MSIGRGPRKPIRRKSEWGRKRKPSTLAPRKPIKKRNAQRQAKENPRTYGPAARREFVRWLPCLVCASVPCENAHVGNGGMSRKSDADHVVPLCGADRNGHHAEYDGGKRSFMARYAVELRGLTMLEHAAKVEAAWQEYRGQLTPLSAIVPGVLASLMEGAE